MQTINLDISKKEIIPILYAKQADVGRKFKAIITDGGTAYPVPAGAAVSIWYSGASGEGNYTDVGANSAVSVSGNEIVVELITQMVANYGVGTMCIVIHTADGKQLGTWNIPYMVEPLPGMGSEAAQAYFTAFSKAVGEMPYPDASLTAAGKAADAAAVGVALAGKAPAGYGLGGTVKTLGDSYDLNNIYETGWYGIGGTIPANAPTTDCYGSVMEVISRFDDSVYQRVTYQKSNLLWTAQRKLDGTVWSEWEWVNPPMSVGTEYRTTERWNGKAVYTKLISFTPSTAIQIDSTFSIPHGITNLSEVIQWFGKANQYPMPYFGSNGSFSGPYSWNNTSIVMATTGTTWGTSYTFYLKLYYTKTTS